MRYSLAGVLLTALVAGPVAADKAPPSLPEQGEYLVAMLGCGRCHTEGMLLDRQDGPWLAGSRIGIAWSAYQPDDKPGVVFPPNLTPDPTTGLGNWSTADIVAALTAGVDHLGNPTSSVMPWAAYSLLRRPDAKAIAAYLQSLTPVRREIPDAVPPGGTSSQPWVRFSVHMFNPNGQRSPEQDQVLPLRSND